MDDDGYDRMEHEEMLSDAIDELVTEKEVLRAERDAALARAEAAEAERDAWHAQLAGQVADNEKQMFQYSALVSERNTLRALVADCEAEHPPELWAARMDADRKAHVALITELVEALRKARSAYDPFEWGPKFDELQGRAAALVNSTTVPEGE